MGQRHPVIGSETENKGPSPAGNLPSVEQLQKKCLNICIKSNSVKTCEFLCNPISALKEITQNDTSKEEALNQAKSIIDKIKTLSKAVALPSLPTDIPIPGYITGQGREEGAPPIPTEIPVAP